LGAKALTAEVSEPEQTGGVRISRYVALGDSFTAGQAADGHRWTDRLAGRLSRTSPDLAYRNLAQPGATSADVLEQQVPLAVEFASDLVSVVCGLNDVLLVPQPDVGQYAANLREIISRLRRQAPGVVVVTATCPNHASRLPLTERVRARLGNAVELLNEVTRSLAGRLDVAYVDLAAQHRSPTQPAGSTGVSRPLDRIDSASIADAFAHLIDVATGDSRLDALRRAV
jgi:lysophospholipase L1-like esterase